MISHFIILSSSYSKGTRIGLHYAFEEGKLQKEVTQPAIDKVCSCFDGKSVSFSTHLIQTDSFEWEYVPEKDGYFQGVKIIDNVDEFIAIIRKDREFKGIDVATYIASLKPCTHSRLEKLTYFCYVDYLCTTGGSRLYIDEIYASEHGPVVKTLYDTLKISGSKDNNALLSIKDGESFEKDSIGVRDGLKPISIKSKLFFAEDGLKKAYSIDRTLSKYDKYTTDELAQMTHGKSTPWTVSNWKSRLYSPISDEDILKYHKFETPI